MAATRLLYSLLALFSYPLQAPASCESGLMVFVCAKIGGLDGYPGW